MGISQKDMQKQLEDEVNALRAIQKDVTKTHQMHRQYSVQQNENEMVQQELEFLDDDAEVFKLIGPVLVKQDLLEAKANVAKRLEYITGEMKRLENVLKSYEQKEKVKRDEVLALQDKIQSIGRRAG